MSGKRECQGLEGFVDIVLPSYLMSYQHGKLQVIVYPTLFFVHPDQLFLQYENFKFEAY